MRLFWCKIAILFFSFGFALGLEASQSYGSRAVGLQHSIAEARRASSRASLELVQRPELSLEQRLELALLDLPTASNVHLVHELLSIVVDSTACDRALLENSALSGLGKTLSAAERLFNRIFGQNILSAMHAPAPPIALHTSEDRAKVYGAYGKTPDGLDDHRNVVAWVSDKAEGVYSVFINLDQEFNDPRNTSSDQAFSLLAYLLSHGLLKKLTEHHVAICITLQIGDKTENYWIVDIGQVTHPVVKPLLAPGLQHFYGDVLKKILSIYEDRKGITQDRVRDLRRASLRCKSRTIVFAKAENTLLYGDPRFLGMLPSVVQKEDRRRIPSIHSNHFSFEAGISITFSQGPGEATPSEELFGIEIPRELGHVTVEIGRFAVDDKENGTQTSARLLSLLTAGLATIEGLALPAFGVQATEVVPLDSVIAHGDGPQDRMYRSKRFEFERINEISLNRGGGFLLRAIPLPELHRAKPGIGPSDWLHRLGRNLPENSSSSP